MTDQDSPPESEIEESTARERASLALEVPVRPYPNRVRVVILQHPREPDKVLGSAALLARALTNARLRVGLSWRSFKQVAGEDAVPAEWAVLYMGPKGAPLPAPVNVFSPKGQPLPGAPVGIKGIILLDGTWSQAKALWWRNAWLTKLRRIVLKPERPSRYGRLRREPRREALSTMESAALALGALEGEEIRVQLESAFQAMLDEYVRRRKASRSPEAL
jgi:DTW domain-containing protein YfiP